MIAMLCNPGPAHEGNEAKPHCWPGRETFSQHQPLMPSHGGWGGHSGAARKNRSDAWVINKRIDTFVRFGKHQGWLAERWREELLFMRSKLACSEPFRVLKQTKTMQTSCLYAIYIACSTVQRQDCSHRQWWQQKNSHVDKPAWKASGSMGCQRPRTQPSPVRNCCAQRWAGRLINVACANEFFCPLVGRFFSASGTCPASCPNTLLPQMPQPNWQQFFFDQRHQLD